MLLFGSNNPNGVRGNCRNGFLVSIGFSLVATLVFFGLSVIGEKQSCEFFPSYHVQGDLLQLLQSQGVVILELVPDCFWMHCFLLNL